MTSKDLATEFLAQRRIAVAGVSRDPRQAANLIYRKLRDSGHDVFAINPRATEVEGARCYPDIRSVPSPVDGVVIVTQPADSLAVVQQCGEAGVTRVWMHRGIGPSSVSDAAVAYCRERGVRVIAGGCPMMYCEPIDGAHRCMRWVLGLVGRLPK